jgi:GNAT superfamily N-acetyltransferase
MPHDNILSEWCSAFVAIAETNFLSTLPAGLPVVDFPDLTACGQVFISSHYAMIRPATPADASAIATLFHRTIRLVNSRDYSPAQVAAWAGTAPDPVKWRGRQATRFTLVDEADGILRGFAELQPGGHLDTFYVSAEHQRQGVGAALLRRIESEAAAQGAREMTTEASVTALPFFLARGWSVEAEQQVRHHGETFRNFRMTRQLGDTG